MAIPYFAVARGKKPGLYSNYEDARDQTDGFHNPCWTECPNRASALRYMEQNGVRRSDVRLFIRAFREQENFKPQSSLSFEQEFKLFASSQNLQHGHEIRSAKVNAMRDEIIYYYLTEGLMLHQVDGHTRNTKVTNDQRLHIYQAMCRQSGKKPHDTLEACLTELKCKPPYVNLLDFINVFRTGHKVNTFDDWHDFCVYTRKKRVDLEYAKKSEFLAPFLQNLNQGPHRSLPKNYTKTLRNQRHHKRRQARPSDVPPQQPNLPEDTPIKLEPLETRTSMGPPGTFRSRLDPPPLSPISDAPSPQSDTKYNYSSPPISQPGSPVTHPHLDHFRPKIKHEHSSTLFSPFADSVVDFEDLIEDDEEIFTQLSQVPREISVKEEEKEEEEILDDFIQDDDEISTQLTQEWSQTPRVNMVETVQLGKRRRGKVASSSSTMMSSRLAKYRRVDEVVEEEGRVRVGFATQ
jgi:hypothetical protein